MGIRTLLREMVQEMNFQVREFFQVDGSSDPHFQEVRFLHEEKELIGKK